MSNFLIVLAIALLPVGGNVIGSVIAESTRAPEWVTGAALHAAAGVAIALVSIDLMPRILENTPVWLMAVAFLGGAAFSVLLARGVNWIQGKFSKASSAAWMVYMATAADLFGDGLMTGVGSAVSSGLGLLLGLSQVVANVPAGFAAIANFREEGVPRKRRILFAASFVVPVLISAGIGYFLLRGTGEEIQNAALAFVVGLLLLATIEDVVPEADAPKPQRWISTGAFAAGFTLFALLSSYVGQGGSRNEGQTPSSEAILGPWMAAEIRTAQPSRPTWIRHGFRG